MKRITKLLSCLLLVSVAVTSAWVNPTSAQQQNNEANVPPGQSIRGTRGAADSVAVLNFAEAARRDAINRANQQQDPPRRKVRPPRPIPSDLPVPEEVLLRSRGQAGGGDTPSAAPMYDEPVDPGDGPCCGPPPTPPPPAAAGLSGYDGGNFFGLGDNGTLVPPDTHGAAGPNHLMITINSEVRVQTKFGGNISTVSLGSFWAPLGVGFPFDPKVLYDPYAGRWMVTSCADPNSGSSSVLMAVSHTSDPTGNWHLFRFDVDPNNSFWADYPSMGFTNNRITVQVNMFGIGHAGFRSNIYVFNKNALYNGSGFFNAFSRTDIGGTQAPAITYDPNVSTQFLMQTWNDAQGVVRLYSITGPVGGEVLNLGPFITGPGWAGTQPGGFTDFAPQAGTTKRIMNNDSRMQNAVYRNGSIWSTHTIFLSNPSRAAVQWWQVNTGGGLQQRGRVDGGFSGRFYAFPSITVNRNNDAIVGYSSFSANQFASASYSYRAGTDALNTMRGEVLFKAGEGPYDRGTPNRWGDYSAAVLDPDDVTMWTLQEYADTGNRFATWWQRVLSTTNPIDDSQFFVRQHYRDFLAREPDAPGWAHWTNEINQCGADAQCREVKRNNVSAAFFLSIEFQESGYFAHKFYRASFNRLPRFAEFMADLQILRQGVIVGQGNWQAQIEANKTAFAQAWVQRPAFQQIYNGMTNEQFVDTLNAHTGFSLTQAERDALVIGLNNGTETRATVVRKVAENGTFHSREFNGAFVLMQYFGYLRRNPDDPPDNSMDGYNFWLNKLNAFNGDWQAAEMVKAFITSTEYRGRFGQP